MNWPEFSSSDSSRKKESQIQGPRPPQLKVSHDSFKIKKPPPHPHHFPFPAAARPPLPPSVQQPPQPVIIYAISPKVIHVEETDFMSVVQRLTGSSASSADAYCRGDISPAVRLASIEKTSTPSERKRLIDENDVMSMVELSVEVGPAPGILSPAPATLTPIPAGFFSPVTDPQTLSFLYELSPYWQSGNGGFMASPSALFSAPINSPVFSPDIFSHLFDMKTTDQTF